MVLPKENRLRHRRDFDQVYQRGVRRGSPCFSLRTLKMRACDLIYDPLSVDSPVVDCSIKNQASPPLKIGISISKKVSKRAVVRNRIKRQVRAALRQLLPQLSPGWHIVIGVRSQAIECDYAQFLQELEQLLVKAEVFHGH